MEEGERTFILHALILATPPGAPPSVAFWAESVRVLPAKLPQHGTVARRKAPALSHPFTETTEGVQRILRTLTGEVGEGTRLPFSSTPARVTLPTLGGRPVGSWERPAPDLSPGMGAWQVPSQSAEWALLIPFLAALPAEPESEGVKVSPSVRFLSEVARRALNLLSRQRFVPSAENGEGPARAVWKAVLSADEDLRWWRETVGRVPPSLLAALPPAELADPEQVVRSLLDGAVDGLSRRWLDGRAPSPSGEEFPEDAWMRALAQPDPTLALPGAALRELTGSLATWGEMAVPGEGSRARTCFRLDPPREGGGERVLSMFEVPRGNWWLRLFVQDRTDPSLLVPARLVYGQPDGRVERGGRHVEMPHEHLLADLARASRLWPELARMLDSPRPEACSLTLREAYDFLREGGPLLAEGGFGILAPPWWAQPPKLSARVRVSGETSGGGLFGLSSLVTFDFSVALGDQVLTREELEALAALKVPLVRLRGQWIEVRREDIELALKALKERAQRGQMTLGEALHSASGGTLDGLEVTGFEAVGGIRQLLDGLSGDGRVEAAPAPPDFHGTLRAYQDRGLAWLAFLRRFGLGGCLADDMGLGKTVQTLAHLLRVRHTEGRLGPCLLVCPTSVVSNWAREAARFAPTLAVTVHHGEERGRAGGKDWPSPAELVVTSYAVFWRDAELLRSVDWDTVILDEAQNIKNPDSLASRTSRTLRARHRVALTGTPVENRLTELWSIMDYLNPGFLGKLPAFRTDFAKPIEQRGDGRQQERLRKLVRPFLLRRLKSDPKIAPDLPPKTEMKVVCSLTREQATLYEATVQDMLDRIAHADGMERRGLVLSALTRLKQICNHPALFLHDRSALPGRSGKLSRLEEMLEEAIAEGDRSLVFTQYAEMGEMLRHRLVERFGVDVPFLHGGTSRRERDAMIATFQSEEGPPVFVLSLKAGGSGLNLTSANRVFHFDRWWNPAVENQATDRAHRIGQTRKVMVHKFLVAGTMEEKIDLLMERKKGLAEQVFTSGEEFLTELSTAELRELFSLRTPGGAP